MDRPYATRANIEDLSLEFYLNTISKLELQNYIASLEGLLAHQPDDIELQLALGIAYHHLAQNGDKSALEDCKEIFAQLLQHCPDDAIVLAYAGNILTWRGHLEHAVHKKLKYTREGIASIDRAISLAPDNLAVRWVRAMNSYHLPSFFGRMELCLADFEHIIRHQSFQSWPKAQQAMIYYRAGLAFQKGDEPAQAGQWFQLASTLAPASKWAQKAEQECKA